ncbi:hypothetical protein G3545_08550 [Starkeya sp. ORNL1]|jgi:hypothetical protein|uniref:hypothetical protein n=1 Tax=Starkeya sp. ORNL1 TaxID=2709380 RepID=UPI00146485AA|nr:hypothetical protein [Starkeya sp. ORNL1]QJP13702.1 hypothetical protein G3545_08550 [Starkeya sp. ORNL1]
MNKLINISEVDDLLFGDGSKLDIYYIERTPLGDFVCFIGPSGAEFTLLIEDSRLHQMAVDRLLELGAPVVERPFNVVPPQQS